MAGRRMVLMLLVAFLVSSAGPGGWSTPVPSLAQDTQDAADMVVYQEPPQDVPDVSVFYEPLAPYGTWTALPEYGQVWIPQHVPSGWRPYTLGRWVYTDYGWTWVSDQPWGWAPFHYGRWAFVAPYGWVWIPGTEWAPAWVVWRYAPGWVGWAPLPPQVVVRPGIEIRAANIDMHINPSWFCFVEERRILAPHVSTYIAPPARNVSLIQITQNVTHYTVIQNRVMNRGIPVERIERVIARPVPRLRVVTAQTPAVMPRAQVHEREREVVLFRPATPPPQGTPGPTPSPQREDTYHRLRERQIRERAALEEQQHRAPQSGPQSLSPEQWRVQRETARQALEDKARREQQQAQQQLQQRQAQERQRALQQQQQQQVLQQQALERQRAVLQQQTLERQRALQQQALERQRAMLQQQHPPQGPLPQGVPPQAFQQPRAATQHAPDQGKEQHKKPPQPPPAQPPAQQ
jgi:hypothetical protein